MQHIIKIPLSAEMIEFAAIKAEQHREIQENQSIKYKDSIEEGDGNFAGFCGEVAAKIYCGLEYNLDLNTFFHDFRFQEYKIEVKSKRTTVIPLLSHEASVTNVNKSQGEFYIFTRIYFPYGYDKPPSDAYIMGWIPRKHYFENAIFKRRGDIDPTNGWKCKKTCWNMFYRDLLPMEKIWNLPDRKKHLERQKVLK